MARGTSGGDSTSQPGFLQRELWPGLSLLFGTLPQKYRMETSIRIILMNMMCSNAVLLNITVLVFNSILIQKTVLENLL